MVGADIDMSCRSNEFGNRGQSIVEFHGHSGSSFSLAMGANFSCRAPASDLGNIQVYPICRMQACFN